LDPDSRAARRLARARLGFLTNAGAVTTGDLVWGVGRALARGLRVTRLFAPEHGVRGDAQAGEPVDHGVDRLTGLPVSSLYEATPLGPEAFADLDAVLVDLRDIGARFSTYIGVACTLVEQVQRFRPGLPIIVLDRPNLLGRTVEGPRLMPGFASRVGVGPLPIRHGLTLGELLRWHVRRTGLDADLTVLRAQGWDPRSVRPLYARPFIAPSPNLPSPDAQLLYAGTCLFEGTNLSEGRGTTLPFQWFGAPWLEAGPVVDAVNASLDGAARLRAVAARPMFGKHAQKTCDGIQVHVLRPQALRPVALVVRILGEIYRRQPQAAFSGRPGLPPPARLDRLWGSGTLSAWLAERAAAPPPDADAGPFLEEVGTDLLYPAPAP
jgi:uncharacterized protein YbbC (DUF1343 family)